MADAAPAWCFPAATRRGLGGFARRREGGFWVGSDGGDAESDGEGQATTALRLGGGATWIQGMPRSSANPGLCDATPLALGVDGTGHVDQALTCWATSCRCSAPAATHCLLGHRGSGRSIDGGCLFLVPDELPGWIPHANERRAQHQPSVPRPSVRVGHPDAQHALGS